LSLGRKVTAVKEFLAEDQGAGSIIEFLLYAGLRNTVYAKGAGDGNARVMPFDASHAAMKRVGTKVVQDPTNAIGQWRSVSCGLKLTLVNNADENDGWWEACRFASTKGDRIFDVRNFDSNVVVEDGQVIAVPRDNQPDALVYLQGATAGTAQMTENPTYMTGKLRDIHKYMFKTRPHSTDHDFQRLKREYLYQDATELSLMLDDMIDYDYDFVFIRLHCTDKTRIMAHAVHNIEAMYEPSSILGSMHTPAARPAPASVGSSAMTY
jgi:hypothetical protein